MIELRDLEPADRDRLFEWRNLPEIRKWMYTDHIIQRDEHDAWFTSVLSDESKKYWVVTHDQVPVGVVNLIGLGGQGEDCQFAIYLAEKAPKELGASEVALGFVLDYAFAEGRVLTVRAEALENNDRAIALYRRMGMREMGGESLVRNGKRAVKFEITSDRWMQRRSGMRLAR